MSLRLQLYTAVDHVVAVWWLQLHFVKQSTRKVGKKKRDKTRRGTIKTTLNQPGPTATQKNRMRKTW